MKRCGGSDPYRLNLRAIEEWRRDWRRGGDGGGGGDGMGISGDGWQGGTYLRREICARGTGQMSQSSPNHGHRDSDSNLLLCGVLYCCIVVLLVVRLFIHSISIIYLLTKIPPSDLSTTHPRPRPSLDREPHPPSSRPAVLISSPSFFFFLLTI